MTLLGLASHGDVTASDGTRFAASGISLRGVMARWLSQGRELGAEVAQDPLLA